MNWYNKKNYISKSAQQNKEVELGYKTEFNGIIIHVENAAGTHRIGRDKNGAEWRTQMLYDYGFIPKIDGKDGDALDVYVGSDKKAKNVYIVEQRNPYKNHKYDEDKVMLGFPSAEEAKSAYLSHYNRSDFFGKIKEMTFKDFKKAVESEDDDSLSWKKKSKYIKRLAEQNNSSAMRKYAFKQETYQQDFYDYQRWVVDAYEIKSALTETKKFISISLMIYNWHNGIMRYQEFWKYPLSEKDRAKKTYDKIIEKIKETFTMFTEGIEESAPNSLVVSQLRAKVWGIDQERLARTNIPSVNYYHQYVTPEADWRQSIYGNRYPVDCEGF